MAFATAAAATVFSKVAASIAGAYAENKFGDGLVLKNKISVFYRDKSVLIKNLYLVSDKTTIPSLGYASGLPLLFLCLGCLYLLLHLSYFIIIIVSLAADALLPLVIMQLLLLLLHISPPATIVSSKTGSIRYIFV